MPRREPFIWQGVEHWVMGEIVETLQLIEDQEDADDFMGEYAEICGEDEAEHNVRYMADLISRRDKREAERVANLFGVDLPDDKEVLKPIHTFGKNLSCMGVKTGGL